MAEAMIPHHLARLAIKPWRAHRCRDCNIPLRPTDLILPTANRRGWVHGYCAERQEGAE